MRTGALGSFVDRLKCNRAAKFRDPEGTLAELYTPVSDAAKRPFGSR
jgi:hypothetical protein